LTNALNDGASDLLRNETDRAGASIFANKCLPVTGCELSVAIYERERLKAQPIAAVSRSHSLSSYAFQK
jgi:hypothetical protein